MARPLRIEYPDAFYHVTARGNERKDIFKTVSDRHKFLGYLESATQRYLAIIHAYCLMSNHYHLLLQTPLGNLSKIMQHINSSYTTYFNVKRKRSGHLLQGRYKAIVIDADSYACELSRYIHLNPVRAGIVDTPEAYPWSSYHGYVDSQVRPPWLTTKFVMGYFSATGKEASYRDFVHDMLGKEYGSPLNATVGSIVLGREDFVTEITGQQLHERLQEREVPALRSISRSLPPDLVHSVATDILPADSVLARKAAIYLCHRYSGARLGEIGEYFHLSLSGVTQASKRFADEMAKDKNLVEKVSIIKKRLNLSNV